MKKSELFCLELNLWPLLNESAEISYSRRKACLAKKKEFIKKRKKKLERTEGVLNPRPARPVVEQQKLPKMEMSAGRLISASPIRRRTGGARGGGWGWEMKAEERP